MKDVCLMDLYDSIFFMYCQICMLEIVVCRTIGFSFSFATRQRLQTARFFSGGILSVYYVSLFLIRCA